MPIAPLNLTYRPPLGPLRRNLIYGWPHQTPLEVLKISIEQCYFQVWPCEVDGMQSPCEELFNDMATLSHYIYTLMGIALNLPVSNSHFGNHTHDT